MISRVRAWYSARRRTTKILLGAGAALASLVLLYVAARTAQYAAASRTPAGLFVPEDAEIVVRVADLAGRWRAARQTELWKSFTRRLQKDAAIRASLNEILAASGAPTLDQLEDRRWLDRNPMMNESSILRFGGRDLVFASTGEKFCVATRVGLGDFLLLPGLQLFPRVAGAERALARGAPVLKRGNLYIAIQGAVVVVSNDEPMLASALQRRGTPETPPGLVRASMKAQLLAEALRGFPLGALFAIADVEACRRIELDVEISGADLVVRAKAEGLRPRQPDPAPVDALRMIPANGLGACFTNVETAPFWDWARRFGDRRRRGGSVLDRFARDTFGDFVEILQSQNFGEEVVPKLDGPVSVLFGASKGDDGKTYAAVALCLRSSRPREAGEALQGVIDRATAKYKNEYKPADGEAGGVSYRSYRMDPDPFHVNNYLAVSYAVTGDAILLANNRDFLDDVLMGRANEGTMMAKQHHYEQAMRRLQELGMKRVMAPGATESLFLYGPALRQGLEGFYRAVASPIVDNPRNRALLVQELETSAAKEGRPLSTKEKDDVFEPIMQERIAKKELELRGYARILDYLKWVAFQAEASSDGMKLELAIELK